MIGRRVEKDSIEILPDPCAQPVKVQSVFLFPQDSRNLRHQVCRMIVISRIDQRLGQFHLLPRRTPIPQAPAIRLFPDDDSTGVGPCSQIGNPLFHTFIMTVQQNRIAIITIIGPGHDHISRSPCRTASSTTEGCGMRNITALPIPGIPHIVKPFPAKLRHIER